MTGTTSPASVPQSVVPSEVGWQFVPQYYTFVNKEPHRLHCFYNKNSTFIHGTEGEDGKPCYGQQEIHNKITSIGFEDCKVFIHSVDAQSSANGGIIIQVIGEMSNHGDPWRKFVQTFFLAEQPNGYFVLNDIFRFLKEETLEGDGIDEDVNEPTVLEPVPVAQTVVSASEPAYELPRNPTPPPAVVENSVPAAAVVADEAPTTDISEPHVTRTPTPTPEDHIPPPLAAPPAAQPNGIHTPETEKPAPVVVVPIEPSPVSTPPAPPTNSLPTPAAAPAPPVIHSHPAAAPAAAPQVPRSWASLAASNPKKWGAAVNQESRGTTEILSNPVPATNGAPAQAVQSVPAPNSSPQQHQHQHQHHQHQQHQQQRGGGGQHGGQGGPRHDSAALAAAQSVSHAHCFVKGVVDSVSQSLLQTTLSSRFGPIKDLELVRQRACAFIEFSSVDSARKAINASSHQGGIWIDVGGEVGQVRISVETKKEKGDRPAGRGRGVGGAPGPGAANGGPERGGGSFRGRGTGRAGGRGGGGGGGGGGGASGPK